MYESLLKVVSGYGLISGFAIIGATMWFSYWLSDKLTKGRLHGSAVAILIGAVPLILLLADAVRLRQRPSPLLVVGAVLVVLGAFLVLGPFGLVDLGLSGVQVLISDSHDHILIPVILYSGADADLFFPRVLLASPAANIADGVFC